MNLFDFICDDHDRIGDDLKKISQQLSTREVSTRAIRKAFLSLKRDLLIHMLAEEEAVYSRLRDEPETRLYSYEGDEQHEIIHTLLDKLEDEEIDLEGHWQGTFFVLTELIMSHVQMEESRVFDEMKKVFSPDRLRAMAVQMKEEKLIVSESLHNACLDEEDAIADLPSNGVDHVHLQL